jgi:hypothetical protein
MTQKNTSDDGEFTYREREAVAVFDTEAALNDAVDELMQLGLRQADMSVLAQAETLAGAHAAEKLADESSAGRGNFVTQDSRTEGMASLVGGPAFLAGLGAALVMSTVGVALVPVIAVAAGGTLAGGGVGALLARAYGRKHAAYIERQIAAGGLLLWVHAPDEKRDEAMLAIMKRNGGRDAHVHVVERSWGIDEVPFHAAEPDPLLRN